MNDKHRKRRPMLFALCAGMTAAVALAAQVPQESCIISLPEGDRDPCNSMVSSGVSVEARHLTVDVSAGRNLVTTPFKGFYVHFR